MFGGVSRGPECIRPLDRRRSWQGSPTGACGSGQSQVTWQRPPPPVADDAQMVRAVFLVAEPVTWFVIVPLSLTALITGIVQSLGTPWGLFRHYWVLFKLLLTVIATIVLMQYTQTVSYFAVIATEAARVAYGVASGKCSSDCGIGNQSLTPGEYRA